MIISGPFTLLVHQHSKKYITEFLVLGQVGVLPRSSLPNILKLFFQNISFKENDVLLCQLGQKETCQTSLCLLQDLTKIVLNCGPWEQGRLKFHFLSNTNFVLKAELSFTMQQSDGKVVTLCGHIVSAVQCVEDARGRLQDLLGYCNRKNLDTVTRESEFLRSYIFRVDLGTLDFFNGKSNPSITTTCVQRKKFLREGSHWATG